MPPAPKLLRLRRVNFSQTINIGGMVATSWTDGHMGWQLSLRPDSGVLVLTHEDGSVYAVGPGFWVSCEVGEPKVEAPLVPALTVAEAVVASHADQAAQAKSERVSIETIRARQAAAQAARSEES